jgi:hypothetical protein
LPPAFDTRYTSPEQDAVLAHELAHLAAKDPLWFLLADLATACLWWHPLAWWTRRSLHVAAELAADEATALVPDGPGALAKCLVNLGKDLLAARGWGWIGINGGFRSKLGMRVERLLRMPGSGQRPRTGWKGQAAKIGVTLLVLPSILLLFGALPSAHGLKADNWRGAVRESWNDSPGGQLLLTALDEKAVHTLKPANRVEAAKALYESGKLNDAEAILVQVTKNDPLSRAARYYLDLIKAARLGSNPLQIPTDSGPQPMLIPLDGSASLYYVQATNIGQRQAPNFDPLPMSDSFAGLKLALGESPPIEPQEPATLYSKVFKVDPSGFVAALTNHYATNFNPDISTRTIKLHEMLRAYFTTAGVNLTNPGKSVFFNDRTGFLYVRATKQDLEIIQQAIETLNASPPQLAIEAKFTILSEEECRGLGFNWQLDDKTKFSNPSGVFPGPGTLVPGKTTYTPAPSTAASSQSPGTPTTPSGIFPAQGASAPGKTTYTPLGPKGVHISTATVWATISPSQLRQTIKGIPADVLFAPKVTTLSGRQAHISSMDKDDGVALDVIATVEPDGYSIQTTAIGSLTKSGQSIGVSASSKLLDTQTLVFGGIMTNQIPGERKTLVVFVTPRIVDPAGNEVHTEEQPLAPRP